MELLIKRRTGIDLNNIPGEVFSRVMSFNQDGNGDINLIFDSTYYSEITACLIRFHDSMRRVISGDVPVQIVVNNNLRILDLVQNTVGTVVVGAPETPVQVQTVTQPLAAPTATVAGFMEQVQQNREAIRVDADIDNINDEEDDVNGNMIKSRDLASQECEPDKQKVLIAKSMRNGLSSSANVINEKITSLNALMAKTLILQNEISVLMEPIESNTKVSFITDQIREINQAVRADSIVKSAYINTAGNISILTNRVYTERLEDETIRDIGDLEIIIVSTAILSETTTTVDSPIQIKNLTHILDNDDGTWTCGHARAQGSICFGNVYPQIHRALSDKNIMLVIELLIKFIRNPNIRDPWGKQILGFPIVEGQNK